MVENMYRPVGRGLEDYLRALGECPDSDLNGEFGVYDNWPILLKCDMETIARDFEVAGIWKNRLLEKNSDFGKRCSFKYKDEGGDVDVDEPRFNVDAHLFNYVPDTFTTGVGVNLSGEDRIRSDFEKKFFESAIMLNPTNEACEEMIVTEWEREMAKSIQEIGDYVIDNNIPLCFPRSFGMNHRKPTDYSRIVYYFPQGLKLSI